MGAPRLMAPASEPVVSDVSFLPWSLAAAPAPGPTRPFHLSPHFCPVSPWASPGLPAARLSPPANVLSCFLQGTMSCAGGSLALPWAPATCDSPHHVRAFP